MISVVIVDDHHAVRLGLHAALTSEPGVAPVGAAASAAELAPLLYRCRPDVVVLDYNLPDADGLKVCRDVKATVPAPAVIVYSAFADDAMTIPAIVAGADGILDKGVPARELFTAIHAVVAGHKALPPVTRDQLLAAGAVLDAEDLPVLSMLVEGTSPRAIAEALRLDDRTLHRRTGRILGALTGSVSISPRAPSSAAERGPAAS
ncbi:MAG TPA: response regulator transcription factor [Conexibacter sp.]|nr:response regulator transcription factor [Conexibacter sp.]